jgi:hypothetical protein
MIAKSLRIAKSLSGPTGGIHSRRTGGGSRGRDHSAPLLDDDEWVKPEKMVGQ